MKQSTNYMKQLTTTSCDRQIKTAWLVHTSNVYPNPVINNRSRSGDKLIKTVVRLFERIVPCYLIVLVVMQATEIGYIFVRVDYKDGAMIKKHLVQRFCRSSSLTAGLHLSPTKYTFFSYADMCKAGVEYNVFTTAVKAIREQTILHNLDCTPVFSKKHLFRAQNIIRIV